MAVEYNKLVLIGNGFDLAHGLKTTYKNFLDWYMILAFDQYCSDRHYSDKLIKMENRHPGHALRFNRKPETCEEVIELMSSSTSQNIIYPSNFMQVLMGSLTANNWIDVERFYFSRLKEYFSNPYTKDDKGVIKQLNTDFDFLIQKLTQYLENVNATLLHTSKLAMEGTGINEIFSASRGFKCKFLNFNYTETLYEKAYGAEDEIISIHGRVAEIKSNPIIFGYGDEGDPAYQNIEDSGENVYLEHIKSFGYFETPNYHKLLSYIDDAPYVAYIVGLSCGLSDRVLLRQIFEHPNCTKIEIFYHKRIDGSDNFKEVTQEISRHFRPQNKDLMRTRISSKNSANIIPQTKG